MNTTRRESDLSLIDTVTSDPRATRSERELAEGLRARLNDGAGRSLPHEARSMLERLAAALSKRPPAERPSASSLLDAMPRPLRPPCAMRVQFAEQKC